jgi:hypothetical protein
MDCPNEKHKPRNNKLGITWCVRCGRLFTKPCAKELEEEDKVRITLSSSEKIVSPDKNTPEC